MAHHLNVLIEDELYKALKAEAKQRNIAISAVVRDALRRTAGTVTSVQQAGWREGYVAGMREVKQAVGEMFSKGRHA